MQQMKQTSLLNYTKETAQPERSGIEESIKKRVDASSLSPAIA